MVEGESMASSSAHARVCRMDYMPQRGRPAADSATHGLWGPYLTSTPRSVDLMVQAQLDLSDQSRVLIFST